MKIAVLMGSPRDEEKMRPAAETLAKYGIEADVRVMSAHRTPRQVAEFAASAREDGYAAVICGAGMAAHLAGAVAANTTLPVIGVPLSAGRSMASTPCTPPCRCPGAFPSPLSPSTDR